jgi:predicted HTH domain antitoxin
MKTISLNLPEEIEVDQQELTMIVATSLYEKGKLSLGQAAKVAGLSKRTFLELLGQFNVSVFNFPHSEIASDLNNA